MEDFAQDSPQTTMALYKDLQDREEKLKRPIIDTTTLIPIGFVTVIIGIVWFAATLTFKVEEAENRLYKVETAIEKLTDVQVQLGQIAIKLDSLQTQINKSK